MFFDHFRKWLNQAIQTVRHGKRAKGRPFVRAYRPVLETLEERVTPTTYTPTTTADLTFTSVNSADGVISGGTGNGLVTLRSAIIAANAHSGLDIINLTGGGTYTLSLANVGGVNEDDCETGDLDVNDSLTIDGPTGSNVIIQAGTNTSNGIDKVLAINPTGSPALVNFTMDHTTIQFGRNTQPDNAADFSYTGGGMDWLGVTTSTLSLTNCVFDSNTNVNGYGGGLNLDQLPLSNGTVTITNCVFNANFSRGTGGGINIFGDNVQVTIANTSITNNHTTGTGGYGAQGGGLNIRITNQNDADGAPTPFVHIDNANISGNQAVGFGGGVDIAGAGNQDVTISNTTILSNTLVVVAGGVTDTVGAGLDHSNNPARTTTLTNVLISNNNSTGSLNSKGGGVSNQGGTLNLRNTTISGNVANLDGGGVYATNGTTTTFTNATITNNRADADNNASGAGGAFEIVAGGSVLLQNTLVDGNFKGTGSTQNEIHGAVTANFSLIGSTTGATVSGANNQLNVSGRLAALSNNGGPVAGLGSGGTTAVLQTHALLAGSPALDNGSSALATGLSTDQRGGAFPRAVDAADADTTDEVDIGALEQHPSVEDVTDQTINEDGVLSISFNVGDANLTSGLDTISITSSNNAVVPNADANINVGGSGGRNIFNSTNGSQTLVITPAADAFGTTIITITVSDIYNGVSFTQTDTFVLTVDPVADLPSVTNATTNEDTQTTSGLVVTRNVVDSNEVTHFKITNITGGTLFKNDGTTQITNNSFITFTEATAGLKFTPAPNLFSPTSTFSFEVAGATSAAGAGLGPAATAMITVNPVADTPSVTNATTNEDTQTTSGLVISRNPVDGAEVTHFKITNIQNGTLFQNDGTTQINSGDFITFTQGNTGLKFTPNANFFGSGTFQIQASLSNADAGLGGGVITATIIVNAVADTPSATNATTDEDIQTTSGLVVSRNAADTAEVTHFKITNILGGTLFLNNGTTQVNNNTFITFAQANAGLKFTPAANLFSPATTFSFDVQASTSNADGGLGGSVVTASITVNPVADTPSVTNSTTNEDLKTTTGLVISRNAADGAEVTHFKITNILNGTLFQNDGVTQIPGGSFITFADGNAGLKFTPNANFFGTGSFDVQASLSSVDAGLGGGIVTATIIVNAVADTPSVTNAITVQDTQTTSGLVISRNPADGPEVTHFKITNITNGTLFQNDGTTSINSGDFITFAQGNAGLKFTPALGFLGSGTFDVQASLSNSDSGLGGGVVTATITVNPVIHTPTVTNSTTNEDTQSTTGLVISRNALDGPEVTHFKITNITNGTLFQNDGTTQINNGDFITFAQGNAGLKFTPSADFFGTSSFDVQSSASNQDTGLGGGIATATIIVNAVADTPSVTNATTDEDTQTTSGLVISRNAADGPEVTHFKITNILGGTLFLNDGTTQITNGSFITFAQGNAGLKFTPAANLFSPTTTFTFGVQASLSNNDTGLGGGIATATITVNPLADTPSVTNATTNEDTQTTSGLVISRNAADSTEVTHFKITNILNGTLFLNDGVTQIANGSFITFAQANAGLKFTPNANFFGTSSFDVQASTSNSNPGLGGGIATATIIVNAVADTPSVTNATTNEDTQTTSGLVITRNPADGPEVTHFKITNILNGTLFLNNGTTPISSGDFITFAQGNAGLKFTPSANLYSPVTTFSFDVQASTGNTNAGLGGGTATATITVNPIADTPSVTGASTATNTQTTSGLVVSRNPADGAEVTHFKITNIQNGTLFQNDGTTPINSGDFITFAQANAGLKFTPTTGLTSPSTIFRFDVQASTSNVNAGLGGGIATANIIVGLAFFDNFDRANSQDLGPNWTSNLGGIGIAGNLAQSENRVSLATVNAVTLLDTVLQVDVVMANVHDSRSGLMARYSGPTENNFYLGMIYNNHGAYEAYIFLKEPGPGVNGYKMLAFKSLPTFTGTGTLRFEVVGKELKFFVNNVLQCVAYDSTITTAGRVGIRGKDNTFNDFSAAEVQVQMTTLPFTDSFSNPINNSSLDRVWTDQTGAFTVQSGAAVATDAVPGVSIATLNTTALADSRAEADVTVPSTLGARVGLLARYSGTGDSNYYLGMIFHNGANYEGYIFVNQGGNFTQLAFKNLSGNFTGAGTVRFEAVGNQLKLFVGNVLQLVAYDSTIMTPGLVGMRNRNANVNSFNAAAIPTLTTNAPFTDNFTTNPNSPNLERVWTERLGAFTQNGQAVAGNFGTVNIATLNLASPLGNSDVSANVTVAGALGARAGLVARYSGPGDSNYYLGMVYHNGANYDAYLFLNQGGNFTQLAFKNLTGIFNGIGTLRFQVTGNTLNLFVNNVLQLTANNGALASGLVGMRNFNASLDDFAIN